MQLFAASSPYHQGHLPVSATHRLYYALYGDPQGLPAVVLHGGPGGATSPLYARYFHPQRYHLVLFDQRGCGRSLPFASTEENDTWQLVGDLERLRAHLGIARWLIFGGSWGATLALAYAQSHPERVLALLLRGVFLGRPQELDWLYRPGGAQRFYPEEFERFEQFIPHSERGDLLRAYARRLHPAAGPFCVSAALAWARWELCLAQFQPDAAQIERAVQEPFSVPLARLETHYFMHKLFFERPDQLLHHAHRLRELPTTIIHGRYDLVCPVQSAYDLARAMPHAQLQVIPGAGHSLQEPGISEASLSALAHFAQRLTGR